MIKPPHTTTKLYITKPTLYIITQAHHIMTKAPYIIKKYHIQWRKHTYNKKSSAHNKKSTAYNPKYTAYNVKCTAYNYRGWHKTVLAFRINVFRTNYSLMSSKLEAWNFPSYKWMPFSHQKSGQKKGRSHFGTSPSATKTLSNSCYFVKVMVVHKT